MWQIESKSKVSNTGIVVNMSYEYVRVPEKILWDLNTMRTFCAAKYCRDWILAPSLCECRVVNLNSPNTKVIKILNLISVQTRSNIRH